MSAFTAGLATAQAAGMALRISCATPVAGPVGGMLGVGFASALAGQASLKYKLWEKDRKNLLTGYPRGLLHGVKAQDLWIDAALGVAMFKIMGGRFRSVMPSDLLKVGAIGRESLPAGGMQYATEEKRTELLRFFRRYAAPLVDFSHSVFYYIHYPILKLMKHSLYLYNLIMYYYIVL